MRKQFRYGESIVVRLRGVEAGAVRSDKRPLATLDEYAFCRSCCGWCLRGFLFGLLVMGLAYLALWIGSVPARAIAPFVEVTTTQTRESIELSPNDGNVAMARFFGLPLPEPIRET